MKKKDSIPFPNPNVLIIDKNELPKNILSSVYVIYIVANSEELIKKRVVPLLKMRQRYIKEFATQLYRVNSVDAIEQMHKRVAFNEEIERNLTAKQKKRAEIREFLGEDGNIDDLYDRTVFDYQSNDVFTLEPDFDEQIINTFAPPPGIIFCLDKYSKENWDYLVQHKNIKILIIDCATPTGKKVIPEHVEGVFFVGDRSETKKLKSHFTHNHKLTVHTIEEFNDEHFKVNLFINALNKQKIIIQKTAINASGLIPDEPGQGDNNNNNNTNNQHLPTNTAKKMKQHGLKRKGEDKNDSEPLQKESKLESSFKY